jgi:hypothetical protein
MHPRLVRCRLFTRAQLLGGDGKVDSKIETRVRLMRWPLVKAGWILCCTRVIGHGGLQTRSLPVGGRIGGDVG